MFSHLTCRSSMGKTPVNFESNNNFGSIERGSQIKNVNQYNPPVNNHNDYESLKAASTARQIEIQKQITSRASDKMK